MEEKDNLLAEVRQLDEMLQSFREEAKQESAVVISFSKTDVKKRKNTPSSNSTTSVDDSVVKEKRGKVQNHIDRDSSSILSTFTRTRNVTLNTKAKRISIIDGHERSSSSINSTTNAKDEAMGVFEDDDYYYEEVEIIRSSDIAGTSFGSQKRFSRNNETGGSNLGSYIGTSEIGLLQSSKGLNNGAFTFSKEKRFDNMESSPTPEPSATTTGHVDVSYLSSRPRNPSTIFHKESNTRRKTSATFGDNMPIPGPGFYSVDDTAIQKTSTHRSQGGIASVGVLYRSPSVTTVSRQSQSASSGTTTAATAADVVVRSQLLGPGAYDVESCDRFVKPTSKTTVLYKPDSKPTPQMERKQYWDQKAADLRDFHDGMKLANDSFTQLKTPTFSMNPREAFNDTDSTKLIALKVSKSVDISGNREYDVKYDFVEKRVATGVSMKSEVTARSSTQKRLESKPGVVKALADKSAAEKGNDRLYGPQLPVPWVEDREVMRSWKSRRVSGSHGNDNDNDGDDSPTREVLQILGDDISSPEDGLARAGTEAFLRSTYSGSLQKRPAPLSMKEVAPTKPRIMAESVSTAAFDYIGPQLQQDWLSDKGNSSNSSSSTAPAPRMDRTPGREVVRVHQKGMVEVIDFSDRNIRSNMDPEPADYYDTDRHFAIAALNNVKGLAFSKAISREDLLPSKEMPLDVELSDELFYEERLDIDYGSAKDRAAGKKQKDGKGIELYTKDRYPTIQEDDDAAPDHVGGTWFKGMYEEIASKAAVVKYDRMVGRENDNDDMYDMDDIRGMEGEILKEGAALDLDVPNWKPSSARVPVARIQDPIKYPRFPIEAKSNPVEPTTEVEAPSEYFETREKVFVNMNKMIGRNDAMKDVEEEVMAAEEIEGKVSDAVYLQVAEQKMTAILRGQDLTSKHKHVSENTVDMGRQLGRPDPTESSNQEEDQLEPFDIQQAQEAMKPRLVWMTDWNKMSGRESSDQMPLPAEYDTREELILEPVSDRSSKNRRVITGPRWEALTEPRFAVDDSIDDMEGKLDIDYIDPGNFKKGMQPIGEGKSSNLGKQLSRPTDNLVEEKLVEEETGFINPRLELAPKRPEKKLMGVGDMSKALPRSEDTQHEEGVMEMEMKEYSSAASGKSSRRKLQPPATTAAADATSTSAAAVPAIATPAKAEAAAIAKATASEAATIKSIAIAPTPETRIAPVISTAPATATTKSIAPTPATRIAPVISTAPATATELVAAAAITTKSIAAATTPATRTAVAPAPMKAAAATTRTETAASTATRTAVATAPVKAATITTAAAPTPTPAVAPVKATATGAAITAALPAKKSAPPEDVTASTPAVEKIKKAEPNPQIRPQGDSAATVDIKTGADMSLKSGDLSAKLRVTFAEDVKPAAAVSSGINKGKPAKASTSTGKPSTTTTTTANSVPKGSSNTASLAGKSSSTSQRSNATPSIEKKKKNKTSMSRAEPTPPHITIPKISDRAPHTVMEGFHDNLSSNEMMSLLNAKLKTLDL